MKHPKPCYNRSDKDFAGPLLRRRCSSSRTFARKFGGLGLFFTSNCFFELPILLLQLLQYHFYLNESKDSKGFKVVTSCNKVPGFVTSCYTFVTFCYNWLLHFCYSSKSNTVKGFISF